MAKRSKRFVKELKFTTALNQIGSMSALLDPWTGKHGGYPRFDWVKTADIPAALMVAMTIHRAEIERITNQKTIPTFANTIAALEDCGRALGRAYQIFGIYTSTMADKSVQAIEQQMAPVLAAFDSEIIQNELLFARISSVYEQRESSGLTAEQKLVVEKVYKRFLREGAALDKEKKARMAEIEQELATLSTTFSNNQLSDEQETYLVLTGKDELAGMSDSFCAAAAKAAADRNMPGKWLVANTRSAMEEFVTSSTRHDMRDKAFQLWISRGSNDNAANNKAIISKMHMLRAEKAKLLGKQSYAHWNVADRMAKTPEAALDLLMKMWAAAVKRAHEEVADMQVLAEKEQPGIPLAACDHRYYAEKVRKAKFDIDESEVRQYLQLDKMLEAVFWAAHKAHGLKMVKVEGLPVVHPDVTVYEARRGGKRIGLCYVDLCARDGKRSGAWMEQHRSQETFNGRVTPIVSINANFIKGEDGQPTLLSWDDCVTLFHEFGHAMHGLLSNVTYPSVSGTSVDRDFVEFPSQLNERWLGTDEVLTKFALHYKTGEPMPKSLIEKIRKADTFNQGFATCEFLASAIYDMRIHMEATPDKAIDPDVFERELMAEIGCPKEIVMRHRPTHFGHIYAGSGYAAGYYSYMWADTGVADASEAFKEAGGFFHRATCKRLDDTIYTRGGSEDAAVAYRKFRGRDIDPSALMRDRGFI
jgi:peptidyl-dipeptidase Dcp